MTDAAERIRHSPGDERRTGSEPAITATALAAEFPELRSVPEGIYRAKAAIQMVLREYFADPKVRASMVDKRVRHFAAYEGGMPAAGYCIVAGPRDDDEEEHPEYPAIDGQALFRRYIDSGNADVEDVKDVLFAIRREAAKLKSAGNPKLKKLLNLVSLAIFDIQLQRRRDIGI